MKLTRQLRLEDDGDRKGRERARDGGLDTR